MAEPLWQKNLFDAMLLDPMILLHGNVKDVFTPSSGCRTLPQDLPDPLSVNFDVWLALELERLGASIVLLYDPIDGAVALRGEMVAEFTRLASTRPGTDSSPTARTADAPVGNASSNTLPARTLPALPRSTAPTETSSTSGSTSGWLTRLDVRQSPREFFQALYDNVFPRADASVAVVCRFTDRYLSYTDRQGTEERQLSLLIQKAAMAIAPQTSAERINSRIALIFNVEGEIPQELNVQFPFARSILIPAPTLEERERFFKDHHQLFDNSHPGERFDPQESSQLRLVANLSDGLKSQDLYSLISLSKRERLGLGPTQFKVLLDRFKFGTRENAWLRIKPETLRNAKSILEQRVKGQGEIIDEVVPVLIRAKLGMSDISASQYSTKPRGVFFFVGPTGVGKTELSKAIAELVFGDEKSLVRFDMSEYSEEHQQARLIGAPPGYVGFDQGGQLTNAIMEKPFSVVLFDEIEKAHGRILDKFLQVLDDGRLTDGMGRTVYFSEAIIIFTSNIGTAPNGRTAFAKPGSASGGLAGETANPAELYARLSELSYEELCDHFRHEVKDFFVNRLGRPEILNRIGEDNILVFNFLKDEDAKVKIVAQQIENLRRELLSKHRVGVHCTRGFQRLLMTHPNGFNRNGARGVKNLLNKLVVNPLAEQLFFDPDRCINKTFKVDYQVAMERIDTEPFDKSALAYEWIHS